MPESTSSSKFLTQLENFGINTESVHRNLSVEQLIEISTQKNEGVLTSSGSLAVKTGKYTGRSPQDRYIIYDDETHETIDWGNVNRQFPSEKFNQLLDKSHSSNTGLDMRYIENTTKLEEEEFLINKHFHNYEILCKLTSDKINEKEKLDIIKKEDIIKNNLAPNIFSGGLLDDFNFDF